MSNSLFASEEDQQPQSSADNGAAAKFIGAILAIPFIPAVLFGVAFYWVFLRMLKLKRSMSGLIALALVALGALGLFTFDGVGKLLGAFTADGGFLENWGQIFYFVAPVSIILGSIIGYCAILWDVHDIKKNPHRVELPGFWTYNIQWRKTPLELLRKKKAVEALKSGELIRDDRAPLGYEEEEDRVAFRFVEESVRHTLVTGAAGSGKTITMLSMMRADIESGRTVIAVDFKRSPEFAAKLASWAKEFDVPFYHFEKGKPESYRIENSLGQSTYDPFASGSGSEMVLNMREYDTAAAVYKSNMQQLLQVVFAMMEQADRNKRREDGNLIVGNIDWDHGGIYQLASVLTEPNLKDLLEACEGKPIFLEAQDYIPKAISGKGMENHSLEELRGQMRTIVASAYGRWFKIGDGSRNIDLLKMMTGNQAIALFSFNSEDEPELSKYVGAMIFADMRACSSIIRNRKAAKITNVYVDEFQAVPPTAVNGLLEKARESKIAMTLAQQAFEQIITSAPANGEAYLQSILVTCSNFITHAGMTQDSAERVSKLLGMEWKTVYSRTNKSDGGFLSNNFSNRRNQIVSASRQEIWKVEPSEFMELSAPTPNNGYRSTAIIVNKAVADPNVRADGTIARKVWMVPPSVVLDEYVTPYVGNEVDPNVQNLYADGEATLLTEEQQAVFDSYDENTPMPQEDEELWISQEEDPFESYERQQQEAPDFVDQGFESFGADYDVDDEDGDFVIEPIKELPIAKNPRRAIEEDLAAFDSVKPLRQDPPAPQPQRRAAAPNRRPAPQPLPAQDDRPLPPIGRNIKRPQPAADSYEEESLPDIW